MSETNSRTVESYNAHIQEYIDGTPHEVSGVVKDWLDGSLADVPKDARILEFGSAFGRDAEYLAGLGYTVECTDATPAFVDLLQQKGFDAKVLNAITDELPQGLDFVLANAVLLHFTRDEASQVIKKVFDALNTNGRFAFTLLQSTKDNTWDNRLGAPRFFCYWTEPQIREVLESAGFCGVEISGDKETANATWLRIVAKKNEGNV
ncbi:class I SAM-dependent methyltransferase [Candidatus Saccharibacteria bacterium]|nr:class I SAM-dependent methyltransferase [Candidatus Saccharibacteria bacterium]